MKIGILGAGHIGATLVRALSRSGHDVKVANSRGPETIDPELLAFGGKAVAAEDAAKGVDAVILSIPLKRIVAVKALLAGLAEETVVIDTSNYYPGRDNIIEAIEAGQVESLWVAEQLGRPIAKAWNAIGTDSFATKGSLAGSPDRLAIPVAADREADRHVTMQLVEATGLDAFDAGTLADSWRQQPGAPAYCTDLQLEEMPGALAAAVRSRLPKRRDLVAAVVRERLGGTKINPDAEFLVALNRLICM